jgi:hypothetical protein
VEANVKKLGRRKSHLKESRVEIKTVNRTIRPTTHKSENSYRVKIGERNFYDKLIVNIYHESLGAIGSFEFDGKAIAPYESIHFKADERNGKVEITWVQNIPVKKLIL